MVHCAAWTAVDLAEDEDKKDIVNAVNATEQRTLQMCVKKLDARWYISVQIMYLTDRDRKPWEPDCKDYAPLNVYGQTKLDGEACSIRHLDKYFIVRIAWVFGKMARTLSRPC